MDLGVVIALIGTVSCAGIVALSYVGAFLMGQARGRRDAELARRDDTLGNGAERLLVVEDAVNTVARSMARLADAQRLMLDEQSHLAQQVRAAQPPRMRVTPPS